MESAHFAENRITGMPLGHVRSVVEHTQQLENVAFANALQLQAARRRAVPIRFNSSPVPSLKSLSLSVAVL